ncbi:MAG: hypothetical protein WC603_02355 [Candidatus Paceibacterota bacterium]|jgi:hypothetical protein
MQKRTILNGGYIGILMLLLGVAIIVFFIIRTDLFTNEKDGKNMIEQNKDAIDKANAVKALMEQKSRESVGE